tara:strand:+ start:1523 stop:1975 length:453 start_codon:yes stop_codon:yes gene_type:complete
MNTKLFDVNVYVIDGLVNVIFYKLIYADSQDGSIIGADTSESGEVGRVVLNLHTTDPVEMDAIRYALDSEEYNNRQLTEWEEYDAWNASTWFMLGNSPEIFSNFYNSLAEYEPTLDHFWETVQDPGVSEWSMSALRKCQCGAEYRLKEWR